jgi:hypothetical protein
MSGVARVLLAVCAAAGTASAMTLHGSGAVASVTPTERGPAQTTQELAVPYDGLYQFVRIRYDVAGRGGFGRGGREPMWAHDYPRADRNFLKIVDEATHVRTRLDGANVLTADDPRLFQHPIAYIVEVGSWNPDEDEVAALSAYLRKGGFVIVDDFRGRFALDNLAYQIDRMLPGSRMLPLDASHDIFDSFFRIIPDEVIPPYGNEPPVWFGVFEDNDPEGRIQMVVNYNNDLAEYWEYSDYGYYPIDLSNEAYKLGVNYVVYAYAY